VDLQILGVVVEDIEDLEDPRDLCEIFQDLKHVMVSKSFV
jgi:hypothetical protein